MSGSVGGQVISFLVDSGASCSLIDVSVYDALRLTQQVTLNQVQERFALADGSDLTTLGECQLVIKLSGIEFLQTFVVAELGAGSAIIGLDFLEHYDIILHPARGKLYVGEQTVPLHRENSKKGCCRISASETFVVPPRSSRVVSVEVDPGNGAHLKTMNKIFTVEGLDSLTGSTGLVLDSGIVTLCHREVPVNLINVHDEPIVVHQGKTLGSIHPVKSVTSMQTPGRRRKMKSAKLMTPSDVPEHVRNLVESSSELSAEQTSEVCELVLEHIDDFMGLDGKTGKTEWAEHDVDVGDASPVKQAYRPPPRARQGVSDAEVERMLKDDIIEPSKSPWASPTVLVTKKDGSVRFCVDYRRLNALTRRDAYPLPRIDDSLNTLGGAAWFCTIDLASGYWQINMKDSAKPYTAFMTRQGLFQFKVMPFGLTNAPATFQRLMDQVLEGLQWQRCLVYLDDIIVFGRTFEETMENLRFVMGRLKAAGLKLKASKCHWFRKSTKYLGHIVTPEGILCDPDKIESVKQWPAPQTVTEVRQFIGFSSYYRKFIPNFSEIAYPLTELTKTINKPKFQKFKWTEDCEAAFSKLKELLISSPILAYPTAEDEFVLDTDASNYAIGAVLSQIQNGEERVIAYASHTLQKTQQNYCTTKRELLAVVHFVAHFRHFLYGVHFTVRTDHASLKWLRNFKNIDGMLARWLTALECYDFTVEHRKGELHGNADGLSRVQYCTTTKKCPREDCPQCAGKTAQRVRPVTLQATPAGAAAPIGEAGPSTSGVGVHENNADTWVSQYSLEELSRMQREDPNISYIVTRLEAGHSKPVWRDIAHLNSITKSYVSQWEALELHNGVLYRRWYPPARKGHPSPIKQLVAPEGVRREVLESLHNKPSGGHLGRNKTIDRVRYRFYWPRYKDDVKRWCQACDTCAQTKPGPRRKRARLGHVPVGAPLERIAIDIMGPLPETEKGYQYIMVIGDYFTKWVEAYPLRDHKAQTVAEVLLHEFIGRFGVPRMIHTDQGREFESHLIARLCELLNIHKTRTVGFNPKSDGMVERSNRTIKQMLTTMVNDRQNDWDDHLPLVMMAIRASVHESTRCTPNLLMLHRETSLPVDVIFGSPPGVPQCPVEYVEWVRGASQHAFQFVADYLQKQVVRHKKLYDMKSGSPEFVVGQTVWRFYPPTAKLKFGQTWQGPYLVTGRVSDLCYRIQKARNSRAIVVHVDHLKLYEGEAPLVSWVERPVPVPVVPPEVEPGDAPWEPLGAELAPNDPQEVLQGAPVDGAGDTSDSESGEPVDNDREGTGNDIIDELVTTDALVTLPNSDSDQTIPYGDDSDDDTLVEEAIAEIPDAQENGVLHTANSDRASASVETGASVGAQPTCTRAGRLRKPKIDTDYVYY